VANAANAGAVGTEIRADGGRAGATSAVRSRGRAEVGVLVAFLERAAEFVERTGEVVLLAAVARASGVSGVAVAATALLGRQTLMSILAGSADAVAVNAGVAVRALNL